MDSLATKYRPKTLSDVLGQPEIVRALKLFAANPYPQAFLFTGDTGTGKTSAAYSLAHDLGCQVVEQELGGFYEIPSGCMGTYEVKQMLRNLSFRPLLGSGWRVLVCNEADRMSNQAENVWLDGLEHLPPSSVVVFTTNLPEKLSRRFRDRCETYAFRSGTELLRPAIRHLARKVWKGEVGQGEPPAIDSLGMPTLVGPESMHASFRLALQQLQKYVREARACPVAVTQS